MSIPPLQVNGTLPPGEHLATAAEIVAAFPAMTIERQDLNKALQDAIPALMKLKAIASDMVVYIDGSFITSKPSPNDIDILVLMCWMRFKIQDFLNQECPIPATYFDVYADPTYRRHLVNVFTRTRDNQ